MNAKRQERSSIAGRLREERVRLGLTQAAVAEATGVSKASQVSYESGATTPDALYVAHLEELGVDVVWLLSGRRPLTVRWKLLEDVHGLIEQWAALRSEPTPPDEKFTLLRMLYGMFTAEGRIDPEAASRAFELVGSRRHE